MKPRSTWQGMWTIFRFNWPLYLTAIAVFIGSVTAIFHASNSWVILGLFLAAAGSFYFCCVSLGVSHLVYDRSDLYRWKWLDRVLDDVSKKQMIFCHSGFDDASDLLKLELPQTEWIVLDHYDPVRMTEASIRRARKACPPADGTIAAPYHSWPTADGCADVIFGFLAIHEFRSIEERADWFREAIRCLSGSGKIVLVEHQRDFANFMAFGPGFLHFHSHGAWRKSWESAGLRETKHFRITPWIRVSVLERS